MTEKNNIEAAREWLDKTYNDEDFAHAYRPAPEQPSGDGDVGSVERDSAVLNFCQAWGITEIGQKIALMRFLDEQLQARESRLREALSEYANPDNWLCDTCDDPNRECTPDYHRVGNWQGSKHGPEIAQATLASADKAGGE